MDMVTFFHHSLYHLRCGLQNSLWCVGYCKISDWQRRQRNLVIVVSKVRRMVQRGLLTLNERAASLSWRRFNVGKLFDADKVVYWQVLLDWTWHVCLGDRKLVIGDRLLIDVTCHGHNIVIKHAELLVHVKLPKVEDAWDAHLPHSMVVNIDRVIVDWVCLIGLICVHLV